MVAFSGMSRAISSNPWTLDSTILFSGIIYGSSRETLTPALYIKLHTWTVFTIIIIILNCLTTSHGKCASQSLVCFTTPSLYTSSFTPVSSNHYTSHKYRKVYFEEDIACADFVRYLRLNRCTMGDMEVESMTRTICYD